RPIWLVVGVGALIFAAFSFLSPADAQQEIILASTDPNHPVEVFHASSSATTLSAAFTEAGKQYYPEDIVSAFPNPNLGIGSVITVLRSMPVGLIDGKRSYAIRTWQSTVGDLLIEKNLELGKDDRISPALATPLQPDILVTITRVNRTTISEFETIEYRVIEQDDPNSYLGTNTVVEAGSNGQIENKFLLIREDGELISKTLTSTKTVKQVVNRIIKIGSKLKIGETYFGKATWYVNSYGTKVAMDLFPAGTLVRITNLNTGKSIIVRNDGCICGATGVLVDLAPEYFQALGGTLGQGVMQNIRVEEIL
ncbi:MAG: G5 domain-containing protein, partial [Patescibacteria group bacterium]